MSHSMLKSFQTAGSMQGNDLTVGLLVPHVSVEQSVWLLQHRERQSRPGSKPACLLMASTSAPACQTTTVQALLACLLWANTRITAPQ